MLVPTTGLLIKFPLGWRPAFRQSNRPGVRLIPLAGFGRPNRGTSFGGIVISDFNAPTAKCAAKLISNRFAKQAPLQGKKLVLNLIGKGNVRIQH
jgi:hypothetical protein